MIDFEVLPVSMLISVVKAGAGPATSQKAPVRIPHYHTGLMAGRTRREWLGKSGSFKGWLIG